MKKIKQGLKVWIANCPSCGLVRLEYPSKPIRCNRSVQIGRNQQKICSQFLTDVRSTRG